MFIVAQYVVAKIHSVFAGNAIMKRLKKLKMLWYYSSIQMIFSKIKLLTVVGASVTDGDY